MITNQPGRWRRGVALTASVSTLLVTAVSAAVVTATAADAAQRSTAGHLQLCVAAGKTPSTTFTVTGQGIVRHRILAPAAGHKVCSDNMRLPHGTYRIHQTVASGVHVSNISVSPSSSTKNMSMQGRWASVNVRAGSWVHVTFKNAAAPTPPPPPPPAGSGYIEVCKLAGDSWVRGSVTVNIAAGTFATSQVVPVGQCTGPIAVPAGSATVSETVAAPYYLAAVSTNPATALISKDLAHNSATVRVVASSDGSQETLVSLTNKTRVAQFKVCKTLTANSGDLISSGNNTFTFDASYTLAGSTTSVSLGSVNVIVPTLQQAACVLVPTALPLGTTVSIHEHGVPNTSLTAVSVFPASQDAGTADGVAMLHIGPNAGGITTASFTDAANGTIEICKAIDDHNWMPAWAGHDSSGYSPYNGTPFQFVINGTKTITVKAGACSAPISVPAGTATIQELATANFNLVGFTATGPDGSSRLVGSGTANPVTVKVPWGGLTNQGVGNETLVTATNQVNVGRVKVCKVLNGVPVGKTFTFNTKFNVGGTWYNQQLSLTPTGQGADGEVCGWLTAPLPVVQPNGAPVTFTTTEGKSPFPMDSTGHPTVEPTDISYAGNGQLIASHVFQPGDTSAQDGTYYGTASLGQGVNVMTFTNSVVIDP